MNLESCFEKAAWQRSRNAPLEKGLKGVRIDVTLVSQFGQEIRLTNLWQLYKHAFGEGYCTCLNDVGTGEIVVKKLEDGTLEVTHYEDCEDAKVIKQVDDSLSFDVVDAITENET